MDRCRGKIIKIWWIIRPPPPSLHRLDCTVVKYATWPNIFFCLCFSFVSALVKALAVLSTLFWEASNSACAASIPWSYTAAKEVLPLSSALFFKVSKFSTLFLICLCSSTAYLCFQDLSFVFWVAPDILLAPKFSVAFSTALAAELIRNSSPMNMMILHVV